MMCVHAESINPRNAGTCVKCGRRMEEPTRPRNIPRERELTNSAAMAGGHFFDDGKGNATPDTGGLTEWAEHRALPGGVRLTIDALRECREELADARNYLVWGIEPIYERYLAGDPLACDEVARNMNALTLIVGAWHALRV